MPASSSVYGIAQLITLTILFVVIALLAFLAAKWFSSYQKAKGLGGNIEMLETYRLGPSRFIAIVRIGERFFAVAVGKDEMTLLAELKEGEFVQRSQGSADALPFQDILEKFKRGKFEKGTGEK